MSCKAKTCKYYKLCLAKYDLVGELHCNDYEAKPVKASRKEIKDEREMGNSSRQR